MNKDSYWEYLKIVVDPGDSLMLFIYSIPDWYFNNIPLPLDQNKDEVISVISSFFTDSILLLRLRTEK